MERRYFLPRWTLANGVGMALGFLAFLNLLNLLFFGLNFELWWTEAERTESAERVLRIGLALGLPLAGAIFTSSQAVVLRDSAVRLRRWILAGPLGFLTVLLVVWPLSGIWGDIPGPVEPFTIVGGGLIMTAVFQTRVLRREGIRARRWLLLWAIGLPLGMVAFMALYTLIDLLVTISWAGEVALIGFAIGGSAAGVSGSALHAAVSAAASPVTPPSG